MTPHSCLSLFHVDCSRKLQANLRIYDLLLRGLHNVTAITIAQ